MELKDFHHHHISILGFNHVSSWALQKLLLNFIEEFLPSYDKKDTPEQTVSKAFTYLESNNPKTFNLQNVFNNPQVKEILIDKKTNKIKKEINPDALDIDIMINTLRHMKCFPTANEAYRKSLACTSTNHQFCCKDCTNGKHKCMSCGKVKCGKSCKSCNSDQSNHDACENCSASQSECNKKSLVCCKQCGSCLRCAKLCVFRKVREALDILLKVRHLEAHRSNNIWKQLETGTFSNNSFPSITSWRQLWNFIEDHLLFTILNYIKDNLIITKKEFDAKRYDLARFGQLSNSNISYAQILPVLKQYANYAMATITQQPPKFLNISFEVTIPENSLQREDLALDGQLMMYVEQIVKSMIQEEDKCTEVSGTNCSLTVPRSVGDYLKLTIHITHHSEAFLSGYNTKNCPNSKFLWSKISKRIKETLNIHYGLDVEIYLEGWLRGSVIIELSIENLKASNLQDIKKVLYDQVLLVMPSCNVEIILGNVETNLKSKLNIALNIKTSQELSSTLLDELSVIAKKESESFLAPYLMVEDSNKNTQVDESNFQSDSKMCPDRKQQSCEKCETENSVTPTEVFPEQRFLMLDSSSKNECCFSVEGNEISRCSKMVCKLRYRKVDSIQKGEFISVEEGENLQIEIIEKRLCFRLIGDYLPDCKYDFEIILEFSSGKIVQYHYHALAIRDKTKREKKMRQFNEKIQDETKERMDEPKRQSLNEAEENQERTQENTEQNRGETQKQLKSFYEDEHYTAMEFQQNPKFIKEVTDTKMVNGEKWYQVVWKQNSFVKESELKHCIDAISNFNSKSDMLDGLQKLSLKDDTSKSQNLEKRKEKDALKGELLPCEPTNLAEDDKRHKEVLEKIDHPNWLTDPDVKKKIKTSLNDFNQKFCQQPKKDEMKKAKEDFDIKLKQLKVKMENSGFVSCKNIEFTGSSYEGLKITGDGLEFDAMLILNGGDQFRTESIEDEEGFSYLHVKENVAYHPVITKCTNNNVFSAQKFINNFKGIVQTFITDLYKNTIKMIEHGPAIQIDVQKSPSENDIWYSVDLLLAFEVGNSIFVPKPLKKKKDDNSWRESFSKQEKQLLKGIDSDNNCRREVTRTLKAIFKGDSFLSKIPSYALKTALFHWIKYKPDIKWDQKQYVNRVFDMLALMELYLDQKWLPNYFLPSQNLFRDYQPEVLEKIKNRIKGIRNKEKKFLESIDLSVFKKN